MPYRTSSDLPPALRNHLPAHAQGIYREAFNHSFAAHAGERRLWNRVIASGAKQSRLLPRR